MLIYVTTFGPKLWKNNYWDNTNCSEQRPCSSEDSDSLKAPAIKANGLMAGKWHFPQCSSMCWSKNFSSCQCTYCKGVLCFWKFGNLLFSNMACLIGIFFFSPKQDFLWVLTPNRELCYIMNTLKLHIGKIPNVFNYIVCFSGEWMWIVTTS